MSRIHGLYAITPDLLDTPELLRQTRQVLQGGARVLQYRNKRADAALQAQQAHALRALTREFACTFIVNDDAELARAVDADGVHIGGADGTLAAARATLGSDKLIGVSCYNRLALAETAVADGADYVAFGSFFASTVKPNAVAAQPELLQQARSLGVPLVAIGGITLNNAAQLFAAGADAVAVISALYGTEERETVARRFAALRAHEIKLVDMALG